MKPERKAGFGARANQSGIGLIEVMLAVFVLSIGFLAAAKMQLEGMRYSQAAYFESQANLMLRDMTNKMRANRAGVIAGHYNNFTTKAGTVNPACVENQNRCNPQQIAQADLHSWSQYLYAQQNANTFQPLLPSTNDIKAAGTIDLDAASNVYNISVSWATVSGDEVEPRTIKVTLTP